MNNRGYPVCLDTDTKCKCLDCFCEKSLIPAKYESFCLMERSTVVSSETFTISKYGRVERWYKGDDKQFSRIYFYYDYILIFYYTENKDEVVEYHCSDYEIQYFKMYFYNVYAEHMLKVPKREKQDTKLYILNYIDNINQNFYNSIKSKEKCIITLAEDLFFSVITEYELQQKNKKIELKNTQTAVVSDEIKNKIAELIKEQKDNVTDKNKEKIINFMCGSILRNDKSIDAKSLKEYINETMF